MSIQGEYKIALIHDELTRRGGAEIVFEELIRLFPQADIYALYAGKPMIKVSNVTRRVETTFLQSFPIWFRRHPRRLLPLLPLAAEQLDFSRYDVVISSASGFVKNIITRANVPHVCYCHTPPRYLWEDTQAALRRVPRWSRLPAQVVLHVLRLFDYAAAQRVDSYIANSAWTRDRIETYYGRNSTVISPPIDTTFFTPGRRSAESRRQKPFLCVGRLTPAKRFEQAIIACEKLELPLVIVGSGDHRSNLEKIAGRHTRFVGRLSREELRSYYRSARALLQPGEEDFGMAAVEALACGTPVIACGIGAAKEIVESPTTGLTYKLPRVEALAEAIRRFITTIEVKVDREAMQRKAFSFSKIRWQQAIMRHVDEVMTVTHLRK